MELGYDALAAGGVVGVDFIAQELTEGGSIGVVVSPEGLGQSEKSPGIEPLGEHVSGSVADKDPVRNLIDDVLQAGQARSPAIFNAGAVPEDKVSEAEFLLHVVSQLHEKGPRILFQETRAELSGKFGHAALGRLKQDRHQGIIFTDPADEVDSRVELFRAVRITLVHHHADIRDDSEQVLLVLFEVVQGFLIAGCKQDFRARTLSVALLLLVQALLHELPALGQHKFVQLRKIGGIIADRVLHQEYDLDTDFKDIVHGIGGVLDQLHDGEDEVRIAVPAEDEVDASAVHLEDPLTHGLGIMYQQDERYGNGFLLELCGKTEYLLVIVVVHAHDHVNFIGRPAVRLEICPGFRRGSLPDKCRRGTQVQFPVFLDYLSFDPSVLLEGESIVVAADHQNLPDSGFHQ